MNNMTLREIGTVEEEDGLFVIRLTPEYVPGLKALDGFSHLVVLWWANGCAAEAARGLLEVAKPYRKAPERMGIFATRSPARPNPIGLSTIQVISVDYEAGVIRLPYMDADIGTPVLDIKPYEPSIDRVEAPQMPAWCAHWPKSYETSGEFNWEDEFLF